MNKHWFLACIDGYRERTALLWEGNELSYSGLRERVDQWLDDLQTRGILPGECVAICGDYSLDACALLIALVVHRNIVVPLPRSTEAQLSALLEAAKVGPVFAFDHGRLTDFSRRPPPSLPEEGQTLLAQLRDRGNAGLVLFSSGSTGERKASLLDFEVLLDKVRKPRRGYRTLAFLLMDHGGGLNTLFFTLRNGGTLVSIADRRAEAICRAIEEHAIELLPTTPTFLRMLLISEAYLRHDLRSLRVITYGTEPMPASTLEHLHRVLPDVQLKQTYGLTELWILQTHSRESGSLWVRVGGEGFETKIVDKTLWIRSSFAMLGYLNAPSPFDGEGWYNTGDRVETDGEYVRFLGRSSEMINVGGEKLFPAEVESVLLEMDNIADATVAGKPSPITGQVVTAKVLLRTPERRAELLRRVRAYCKDRLAPYKIPVVIEISETPLHGDRFKKARLP